jgi:hypothetical protein
LIVNEPVVAPAAIFTDAGKVANTFSDASWTNVPPEGAGNVIETVPVDVTPPATAEGDNVKLIAEPVGRTCPNEKPVTKQSSKTKAKR